MAAKEDGNRNRLMTIPDVGSVTALAYTSTIDIPQRFRSSKAVGPILGLTPKLNESGESRRVGRISLCGDGMMRTLLYEAAQTLLTRVTKWSCLKAWAMNVAKRRGMRKAIVALARRLAVIMHRMWLDGSGLRWTLAESCHCRTYSPQKCRLIHAANRNGIGNEFRSGGQASFAGRQGSELGLTALSLLHEP